MVIAIYLFTVGSFINCVINFSIKTSLVNMHCRKFIMSNKEE